ncbi:MAG: methylenetetrahydrofolate reductase [Pseudobdellovibrio sp.]
MYIIDHIERAKNKGSLFSFEIVPPSRGRSGQEILDVVEMLLPFNPAWMDVTSHSSSAYYRERHDGGLERKIVRKRPGTLGICGIIQNRYKIDTVAHVLCLGFSKEETEDALIELNFLGIHNILALRGDTPNFQKNFAREKTLNQYAHDLVSQISDLKKGKFLEELDSAHPLSYCIGVAGYPEKHYEAPSLKIDIQNMKKKIEAGAEYITTQMFFDNRQYFSYVEQCRAAGITVPIIPGLKVIRSVAQLQSLPKSFHIDLPDQLADEITENPKHVVEIGKNWALKQAEELMNMNVPSVHFYVLNDAPVISDIIKKLQKY